MKLQARVDECRNRHLYLFALSRAWCKTPSMTYASIMFTCCLTRDCGGSGKYLRMRSYILSNAHTWFSGYLLHVRRQPIVAIFRDELSHLRKSVRNEADFDSILLSISTFIDGVYIENRILIVSQL